MAYGTRAIGVVLTGQLDDGTAGLQAIARCGGLTVVQDPKDAAHSAMPKSATENVHVDHGVPVAEMGALLATLVAAPAPSRKKPPADIVLEAKIAERVLSDLSAVNQLGEPAPFNCPQCGAVLWKVGDHPLRYRCHTAALATCDSPPLVRRARRGARRKSGNGLASRSRAGERLDGLTLHDLPGGTAGLNGVTLTGSSRSLSYVPAFQSLAASECIPTKDLVGSSILRSEYPNTVVALGPYGKRHSEGGSLWQNQFGILREMINDMDTQTVAGQQVTMKKIVAFLRSRIGDGALFVVRRNGRELSKTVDQLAQEAGRPVPDVRLFSERVEALAVLLSATT